jgi:hypothetical protein
MAMRTTPCIAPGGPHAPPHGPDGTLGSGCGWWPVRLEGSVEDFGLDAVVDLLVHGRASGVLAVVQGGSAAGLALRDGVPVAASVVGGSDGLVDALTELLGWQRGSFCFDPDAVVPAGPGDPTALEQARRRSEAWRERALGLPEDTCRVMLSPTVDASVTMDPPQWSLIAAVDGRRSIAEVIGNGGLAARIVLAQLLDQGLVIVQAADAPDVDMTFPRVATARPRVGAVVGSLALAELPAPSVLVDGGLLHALVVGVRGL